SRRPWLIAAGIAAAIAIVAPVTVRLLDGATEPPPAMPSMPSMSAAGTQQAVSVPTLHAPLPIVADPPPARTTAAAAAAAVAAATVVPPQVVAAAKVPVARAEGAARPKPLARATTRRNGDAAPHAGIAAGTEQVPRPAPVPGKCTPQVAALGLCTLGPN
ncbi:MAG TPA: hypothetical protein VGP22_14210, partial [Albitalea sp.]|nr:hypothetical protein [Albitalea sp.]